MHEAFPDVKAGDRITGMHQPGVGARFWFNGVARWPRYPMSNSAACSLASGWPSAPASRSCARPCWPRPRREPLPTCTASGLYLATTQGWRYGLVWACRWRLWRLPSVRAAAEPLRARTFGVPLATLGAVTAGRAACSTPSSTRCWAAGAMACLPAPSPWCCGGRAVAAMALGLGFAAAVLPARRAGLQPLLVCGPVRCWRADLRRLQRTGRAAPVLGCATGWRRGAAQPRGGLARRPGPVGRGHCID